MIRKELLEAIEQAVQTAGQKKDFERKVIAWIEDLNNGIKDAEISIQHADLVIGAIKPVDQTETKHHGN